MSKTSTDDPGEAMVEMESFQTKFDDTEESVSEAVVSAVATVAGVDPTEMPPLYNAIDPDALDALFRPVPGSPRGDRSLQFIFNGYEVIVKSSGVIVIDQTI